MPQFVGWIKAYWPNPPFLMVNGGFASLNPPYIEINYEQDSLSLLAPIATRRKRQYGQIFIYQQRLETLMTKTLSYFL